MSEAPPPTGSQTLSLQKIWQFFANVLRLERSVRSLEQETGRIQQQMLTLQRELDEQRGKLNVLVAFIRTSLHGEIDKRTDVAVIRAVERLVARQDEQPPARPRGSRAKKAKPQE